MASSGLLLAPDFKCRERKFSKLDRSAVNGSAIDEYTSHCSRTRHLWPRIRAIHSKDDKEFVSYLRLQLGKMCYDVLEDGESHLGGRDYRLVVVVLSEKFLTDEACMAKFMLVENDRPNDWNFLYLFLHELSVQEFLNQNNLAKWGHKVGESSQGIEVLYDEAAWRERLEGRTLDCSASADGNIIEFVKIIAQTISSRFIPLQVHWSQQARSIKGKKRLCQDVDKCFFEPPLCNEDVRVLGLHGMWSVGKTSLAKALCEFYYTEFEGRVYHAELLKKSSHLQLMRELLGNLFGAKQDFLEQNLTDLSQAYAYLDHCLRHLTEKVFLVVDNIQDSRECLERARDLFLRHVPFPKGSMVLCFARTSHTLEQLLLPFDKNCIKSMPLLNPRDGYKIFLEVLSSDPEAMSWQEVKSKLEFSSILHLCVDQQPHTMEAVHPLRFKSLGCFFIETGAQYWLSAFAHKSANAIFEDIKDQVKWNEDNYLKTVFKALQEIYDSLDTRVQQVFIDIALYVPRRDLSWLCRLDDHKDAFFSSGFECLQKLRAVTLLTLDERKIEMHSLCRNFAEKVARHSEAHVYIVGETVMGAGLSNMLNHRADVIERVSLEDCLFEKGYILDLSNCRHLQVLRLLNVKCDGTLEVCLGDDSKLSTLEISSVWAPVSVTGNLPYVRCFSCCLDMVSGKQFPLGENLEVLEIKMSKRNSGYGLEHPSKEDMGVYFAQQLRAHELEVLRLSHCEGGMLAHVFWRLRELTLFNVDLQRKGDMREMKNLRTLHLQRVALLQSLDGTESLRLQEVHVIDCKQLSQLQLPAGMWLKHCCIWRCGNLKGITVCGDGSEASGGDCVDDDEVDEMRRYYPGPDEDDEMMTCSGQKCREKFISFSSETKLSIVECSKLSKCDGLAKLTSIKAFKFGSYIEDSIKFRDDGVDLDGCALIENTKARNQEIENAARKQEIELENTKARNQEIENAARNQEMQLDNTKARKQEIENAARKQEIELLSIYGACARARARIIVY